MEFILQVEDKPFVNGDKKLYKSTAFESLVFDQKGLNKLERYDRAKHEAEKNELTKLRGQVGDLCNEVNRLTSLESKSYGIGFQEGYDTGLKKLHDALKAISTMTLDERMDAFGTSSIFDVLNHYDPFRIIDVVIISMIYDYAKANEYEPDETLRTVANNILSFLSIASLNEWIGDMDEESD